jgi:hypothetical protein
MIIHIWQTALTVQTLTTFIHDVYATTFQINLVFSHIDLLLLLTDRLKVLWVITLML